MRRRIDQALDDIGRLGAAGAAIGIDRHGIGIGAAQSHIGDRDVVNARRHADAEPRDIGRVARQIRAHVSDDIEIEREEAALVVERHARGGDVVAALAVAEEMLAALGHPFHRLPRAFRRHRRQRIFAIGKELGAEAAADIGRDDPHLVRRDLEHLAANDVADDVAALAADGERVAIAIVLGDDAAGVEIVGDQPLIDQRDFHLVCRLGEGAARGFLIADGGLESEIARPIRPDLRGAGFERRHGADHVRQRLPVDGDGLGGVFGLGERVGNDEGNGVADVADDIARQNRIRRHDDRHVGDHARRRQRSKIGHVLGCQQQPHAGHRPYFTEVADAESRVRVRRAQHDRVQTSGRREVGDVVSGAAQQRGVLLARQCLAEAEFHRRHGLFRGLGAFSTRGRP